MSIAKSETRSAIASLFEPSAIAVIGASDQPGNLGGRAVRLLRKFGFPGAIWPVNPRRATVADLQCYPSLKELPGRADLAIIAVGAASIADMVEQCVEAGIQCGIVWAAGFAEVGGEGVKLQRKLTEVCRRTGFQLCGPNSIGIINSWQPMTGSFASSLVSAERLLRGSVSMVSQSGGLGTAAFSLAQQDGFGFRHLVSTGNEAVLTTADFLQFLVEDEATKVIAVYLEGLNDGPAFLSALENARAARKPVVVLKTGSSAASARAVKAHTGALAGEDRVWQAIFREQAAIPVESNRELLDVALSLSTRQPESMPRGKRVAIVTFGGGGGVLSTELCARYGMDVPSLAPETIAQLATLLPPIASTANPVDMTPDMFQPDWLRRYPEVLKTIAADPNIDMLLLPLSAMARGAVEVANAVLAFHRQSTKPVFVSWTLAPTEGMQILADGDFFVFPEQSRAIGVMGKIAAYASAQVREPGTATPALFDWAQFMPNPVSGAVVSENACHEILAAAGLSVPAAKLVTSEDEAIAAAKEIQFPVVMKGISPQVTHRAAAGLIALDLRNLDEVREAYRELTSRALKDHITLDGVFVEHMVKGKLELLVSAFRDPIFGVMVVCGAGGNFTELLDDVTLERAPFDETRAAQVLKRLKIVQRAGRIDPGAELTAAAEFVSRFSALAASAPWRRFVLEVNPIKWQANSAVAVDGLLIIEEP